MIKKYVLKGARMACAILCLGLVATSAQASESFSFDDIHSWIGEGTNRAGIVIDWNNGRPCGFCFESFLLHTACFVSQRNMCLLRKFEYPAPIMGGRCVADLLLLFKGLNCQPQRAGGRLW